MNRKALFTFAFVVKPFVQMKPPFTQGINEETENFFFLNRKQICYHLEIHFEKSVMGVKGQILPPGCEFAPGFKRLCLREEIVL